MNYESLSEGIQNFYQIDKIKEHIGESNDDNLIDLDNSLDK